MKNYFPFAVHLRRTNLLRGSGRPRIETPGVLPHPVAYKIAHVSRVKPKRVLAVQDA
jgi:hypothetical protein